MHLFLLLLGVSDYIFPDIMPCGHHPGSAYSLYGFPPAGGSFLGIVPTLRRDFTDIAEFYPEIFLRAAHIVSLLCYCTLPRGTVTYDHILSNEAACVNAVLP